MNQVAQKFIFKTNTKTRELKKEVLFVTSDPTFTIVTLK